MIQRIQTLYFVIVIALNALILATGFMNLDGETGSLLMSAYNLKDLQGNVLQKSMPLATLFHISIIVVAVAVFMFKKRMLQIRISIFSIVLFLASYGLIFYYFNKYSRELGASFGSPGIGLIIPLINAILLYMALRAIGKDEALVRSIDRIR